MGNIGQGMVIGVMIAIAIFCMKYAWGIPINTETLMKFAFGLVPIGIGLMLIGKVLLFLAGNEDKKN